MATATASPTTNNTFLPDFCAAGNLLRTMLIAQLLAFVLVAVGDGGWTARAQTLALTTLFIQWVAILDAALLCLLREPLRRLDERVAATLAFIALQAVTLGVTLVAGLLPVYGDEPVAVRPVSLMLLENIVVSSIVGAVALRYFYVTAARQRQVEAAAEARVQALQARIRPHFLFNSMNTIASLTRIDPQAAETAIEDLSELFRAALAEQPLRRLDEELAFVASYLRIESLRLGDRLGVAWDLDPAAGTALVPALSLQPLVENAVYHGIETRAEGGTIHIASQHLDSSVRLVIDNPAAAAGATSRGNAMAQDNVRQRFRLAWGERARFVAERSGYGYHVIIEVPADANPDRG